jgi:6-phospho-beta-glucosidase
MTVPESHPAKIKLAVLGGSSVATPQLIQALKERSDCPPMQVVLLGRAGSKLERVAAVSARLAAGASIPLSVTYSTDLMSGLAGANYILNQVRVGGYQARAFDESFPHVFGIPGEETFGPGGMNNALRTIPVTLEHCRLIEQVAPDALLINLTNPSSYIQYAVARYSRVQVVGVCDTPVGLVASLAKVIGAPREELWVGYTGMHHFGWVTEVCWKGQDVMPQVLSRIEELPGLPVDAGLVRAIGAIPTSYFKYYYHPNRMLDRQRGQKTRAEELLALEADILADYEEIHLDSTSAGVSTGIPASLERRGAHWYGEIVVPVLLAHANDARAVHILNVSNGDALPWMPADAIVELAVVVARHGFHPLQPPVAPPDLQAMVRLNAAFEMLWVEAVVEGSYDKALRAMALNHLVQNLDQARAILDTIWPGA